MTFIYQSGFESLKNFMGSADGFNEATRESFELKAQRDFDSIKFWIPYNVDSTLDIGCGLGSINILIARETPVLRLNIIDGEGITNKLVSYRENAEAWMDRKVARDFIVANIGWNKEVYTFPPDPSITIESDLVISLKSWGHHYPVSTYLGLVQRSLRPSGRVIMDIRKSRKDPGGGRRAMEEGGFRYLATTYETPKCERMVFCRV